MALPDRQISPSPFTISVSSTQIGLSGRTNKSIMEIKCVRNWKWFNNTYLLNGLFKINDDELNEFDIAGISY